MVEKARRGVESVRVAFELVERRSRSLLAELISSVGVSLRRTCDMLGLRQMFRAELQAQISLAAGPGAETMYAALDVTAVMF